MPLCQRPDASMTLTRSGSEINKRHLFRQTDFQREKFKEIKMFSSDVFVGKFSVKTLSAAKISRIATRPLQFKTSLPLFLSQLGWRLLKSYPVANEKPREVAD